LVDRGKWILGFSLADEAIRLAISSNDEIGLKTAENCRNSLEDFDAKWKKCLRLNFLYLKSI